MFTCKLGPAVLYVTYMNFSLLTLWDFMACSGVKFTLIKKLRVKYKNHNYIYILHLTNDQLPLLKNSRIFTVI